MLGFFCILTLIPGRNDKILALVPLRSASSDGGENSESDKDELQSSDSGSSSPAPSISSSLMNLSIDSLHDDAGVNLCDNDKITNKFCNHPLDNITSAGGIESEKNAVNENVSLIQEKPPNIMDETMESSEQAQGFDYTNHDNTFPLSPIIAEYVLVHQGLFFKQSVRQDQRAKNLLLPKK
ncbi:hypothetical protein MSG28_011716 [Choristoneura fumiferana]|uniref:Uncharacterized protein n=1 Tax=Choristoneura fumiferana TaxID=7141 RepID=A0ACC0KM52_CHOFU|nr:hypothetical protein MSG28_011716 [Choristoneura fumiferana]